MRPPRRPWLLVAALATLGILVGHEIAYAVTGTSSEGLHGYVSHLPQIVLILSVLSLAGASFVKRGARLSFWPFPAVTVIGFVAQEHLEQLQHGGSLPFLLNRPVFLVGVLIQCLVALAAWMTARLLLRVLQAEDLRDQLASLWSSLRDARPPAPPYTRTARCSRPRAPPAGP